MGNLKNILDAFFKGIARSRVSLIGAIITTAVFPFLLGLVIIDSLWHIDNPYMGAIIYMILGPAFMGGLAMVFVGLFFLKGKEEVRLFTLDYLKEHFTDETRFARVRKLIFLGIFLTGANLFIFSLLGYSGYHYLESNAFCGKFCHTVMEPEYTAYQNSPHSRVNCVECHIGSGATWFVKSKISGARQLFAVALDTYPRPIETPVHGLRPARETCEECHQPEKFHGEKLIVNDKFLADDKNTHVQTVMLMKIGSAGNLAENAHGIHWHVAPENTITYQSDEKRLTIPVVTLTRADGTQTVFRSSTQEEIEHLETREMDCIDCHNRPTHIYRSPEAALDEKLLSGKIPRQLPFVKEQALIAITDSYTSQEEAEAAIAERLTAWYKERYPDLLASKPQWLQTAIRGTQEAYRQNVWPSMNIAWNTYINHIGHGENFDIGCFRCHDDMHESEDGQTISGDCTTCHVILAENEENPEVLRKLRGE